MKTLPGTRAAYNIKCTEAGAVATENLSCFCPAGSSAISDCQNSLYVEGWEKQQLWKVVAVNVAVDDETDMVVERRQGRVVLV